MIAKRMEGYVKNNSAIRMMFEEGKRLANLYGKENVYDFSLGNPNVPAPASINDEIKRIVDLVDPLTVHGYMSNAGFESTREAVAASLKKRFDTDFTVNDIIMVAGAAAGLNATLKAILDPEDEVLVFAPYFLEYRAYVTNYDAKLVEIAPDTKTFMPDVKALEKAINVKTKALILNNPNNPTGVIYDEEVIKEIALVLSKKEKEIGHPIFLISDEPYRELAYDGARVPFVTKYYRNSIVCYSFSKSLSLPGERIGYVAVPNVIEDHDNLFTAIVCACRITGFVNAPSLMQLAVERCIDEKCDLEFYDKNRKDLYDMLTELGFECVKPQGAFYLFVKSPVADEKEFVQAAVKKNILFVGGSSFACPGYVRMAYCVSNDTIKNSRNAFTELAKEFNLK